MIRVVPHLVCLMKGFCFAGGQRWAEHRELSVFPASLHGAVAEGRDLWRDDGGYEKVKTELLSSLAFDTVLLQVHIGKVIKCPLLFSTGSNELSSDGGKLWTESKSWNSLSRTNMLSYYRRRSKNWPWMCLESALCCGIIKHCLIL